MVRVLVLGATGRLGGMLRRYWVSPEIEPLWQARQGHDPGAGDWVVFDPRTDPLALAEACAAVDVVLDLAGPVPGPGRAVSSFAAIPPLARAVAHGVRAAGGRSLLWASSAAVYGARARCGEDDPLAPLSDYGRAKQAGEAALAGVPGACALRIGNVAGADALLSGAHPGVAVTLDRFADGTTPLRSYLGPKTLAETLFQLVIRAAEAPLPPVLNLSGPGPGVAMGDLLEAAGIRWQPRPAPEAALPEVVLDTARLTALVPLSPEAGTARRIVAEWRADQAALGEGRP
ncbi:NAD-dependent epimerase/dehydratase family protein [Dinoroseobacter sp. S375]|uniref:NAD-dependent epimerase/dehydratase family protein n=1 Tax=Dinoroseobacter sp. S375 TaxID=3415136 RepID=UPI003C7C4624